MQGGSFTSRFKLRFNLQLTLNFLLFCKNMRLVNTIAEAIQFDTWGGVNGMVYGGLSTFQVLWPVGALDGGNSG